MRGAAFILLLALFVPASAVAADFERIAWEDGYAPADRRVVRIFLTVGSSDQPSRARVRESSRSISITLLSSRTPPGVATTADAVAYCVEVRLTRVAGGRRLLDRDRPRPSVGPGTGSTSMAGPRPCVRLPPA